MIDNIEPSDKANVTEPFDTAGLFLEYLVKWKWFVANLILCLAITWIYIARQQPDYTVNASIYLNDENNRSAMSIFADQPSLLNLKDNIDEAELGILKSSNNLVKVVEQLNLSYAYYHSGRFRYHYDYGTSPLTVSLDSASRYRMQDPVTLYFDPDGNGGYDLKVETKTKDERWTKNFTVGKLPAVVDVPQGRIEIKRHPLADNIDDDVASRKLKVTINNPYTVAKQIGSHLLVEFAKKSTTIVNITYEAPSPEMGIDVINSMINVYNQDIKIEKNRSAMQTEEFIINRLALVESELNDAEHDVESYRRANNITDISGETSMALERSQRSDAEVAKLEVEMRMADDIVKMLTSSDNYTPIPTLLDESPTFNSAVQAYNKKLLQRTTLLESGTENNPLVKTVQEEIAQLRNELYRHITNKRNQLIMQRNDMARQENASNSKLASMPGNERELFGRIRKQTVKENIYNFLLEKREEIAIQKTLATPMARLIDDPSNGGRLRPRSSLFYLIALLMGLAVPAVIIYVRRALFPNFMDKDELARHTKVPILGELAVAPAGQEFVVSKTDTTAVAELFRLMRNNVQFILGDKSNKVILITSTFSGEGKTFVASNLALAFALAGKKTIVVGMDIRRPFLAHRFDISNNRGLTSYLSGIDTDIDSMIMKWNNSENLYVLPAGPVPPNPNELLMSPRLNQLFEKLRSEYDYIVIDSAPIGVVSDTLLITPMSDIQIYVTRADFSTRRCLDTLHTAITEKHLRRPYIIMNGVNIKSSAYTYKRYGHYSRRGRYYGSEYGYGYGYGSDDGHSRKRSGFLTRFFGRKK